MGQVPTPIRAALILVGFSAVVAQIILMRELLIASYGNELSLGIMLAVWLVWTAVGSHALGQLLRRASSRHLLSLLLIAAAISLYLAIIVVRVSRTFWSVVPGEALGPLPILFTALFTLAVFCPISGWLFTLGSRFYAETSQQNLPRAGSSMYLFDAMGSAIGGLLASIIFVRFLNSIQVATVIAMANLVAAVWLVTQSRRMRQILSFTIVLFGIFLMLYSPRYELSSLSHLWPGFRVLATSTSPYGDLAVIETEGNRSVVQNGIVLFTSPDPMSAEEAVHFPLLEHPRPKNVLLIGGGLNGSLVEILKHPTVQHLDYVELDPAVIRLGRAYFPQIWSSVVNDPRLHIHELDGRLFVRSKRQAYDVVIVNLPEPQTAQLNRFYTSEWFREVSSRLAPDGVFGFQMHASEEYLSPPMTEFLRCLSATLRQVFPNTITIPGETIHFLAAKEHGTLSADSRLLLNRLTERGIQTAFVREYYLPFRMTTDRVEALQRQLQPLAETRINRDLAPIAYFFNIELWSTQFSNHYRPAFRALSRIPSDRLALLVLIAISAVFVLFRLQPAVSRNRFAAGFSVAIMGMTIMGAEILLLLGFQAVYGYVFNELAVIIAGFMVGMAIGSWLAIQQDGLNCHSHTHIVFRLLLTQTIAIALLLVATPLIACMRKIAGTDNAILLHLVFLLFAVFCGVTGGYQFPFALRIFSSGSDSRSPGSLYALDLVGASFGAIAISAWMLPLFGFSQTAGVIALANLGSVLLLAFLLKSAPATS